MCDVRFQVFLRLFVSRSNLMRALKFSFVRATFMIMFVFHFFTHCGQIGPPRLKINSCNRLLRWTLNNVSNTNWTRTRLIQHTREFLDYNWPQMRNAFRIMSSSCVDTILIFVIQRQVKYSLPAWQTVIKRLTHAEWTVQSALTLYSIQTWTLQVVTEHATIDAVLLTK